MPESDFSKHLWLHKFFCNEKDTQKVSQILMDKLSGTWLFHLARSATPRSHLTSVPFSHTQWEKWDHLVSVDWPQNIRLPYLSEWANILWYLFPQPWTMSKHLLWPISNVGQVETRHKNHKIFLFFSQIYSFLSMNSALSSWLSFVNQAKCLESRASFEVEHSLLVMNR